MTDTYDEDTPFELKVFEEMRCTRCVLERILNHLNSQLFLDYQLEKFNKSRTPKVGEIDPLTGAIFKPGGGWAKAMQKAGKK